MSAELQSIVEQSCMKICKDASLISQSLLTLEKYLDRVVTELGEGRNVIEEALQAGLVPEGMDNQLWSRLGTFDRIIQQMYARQQTAVEKVIELRAHIDDLRTLHDRAGMEAKAFNAAEQEFAQSIIKGANTDAE